MRHGNAILALLIGVASAAPMGCAPDYEEVLEVPALDLDLLDERVQPMFDRKCAQTSCHGELGRPLRLFSREGMRLVGWEGTKTLGIDELVANADMVRGFLAHEADVDAFDSVLVRKPLRQAAGGVGHQGGDQFYDLADPDLLLMVCWMEGGGPECGP